MTEPIKPALTAEEWAEVKEWAEVLGKAIEAVVTARGIHSWEEMRAFVAKHTGLPPRHATAALALYGQPFGFTREDVVKLRAAGDAARDVERFAKERGAGWDDSLADWYHSLADRIESLLPPETKTA